MAGNGPVLAVYDRRFWDGVFQEAPGEGGGEKVDLGLSFQECFLDEAVEGVGGRGVP